MGVQSWVGDSLGSGSFMVRLEHSGARRVVEGVDDHLTTDNEFSKEEMGVQLVDFGEGGSKPLGLEQFVGGNKVRRMAALVSESEECGVSSPRVGAASNTEAVSETGEVGSVARVRLASCPPGWVGVSPRVQGAPILQEESLFGVPLVWEGKGTKSPIKSIVGTKVFRGSSPWDKVVKLKELSNIMGTLSGNRSLDLAPRLGAGMVEGRLDFAESFLDESGLVDVRVDQLLLVHLPEATADYLFTSDSAIENCNKLFWVNSDKNEVSNVWCVGKEVGFLFPGREGAILNSLLSLSNWGTDLRES